uniref:Complex I assembly factor TIMMDC1, mitochondrial n=1 Tax=Geotrypetes seraphini TaxID=260995 RepID=A0A6P8QEG7_GEOSA|nr:complex I assembly factor TIMMDC1, mitochondrial [Geotrypetes seraphini]XP_033797460.1 complex I assembly factor TIMMDC1, mitochondrial [Geotrypetes seraphini]XP_033797461.1 complex I assembly factor TIMMDC1, mitochondrial [Geotrypetes seraphini]XP_033797462.1 complex I assembly factor TIMMDC1, mitochondrial [Geotrypetes seraphini]
MDSPDKNVGARTVWSILLPAVPRVFAEASEISSPARPGQATLPRYISKPEAPDSGWNRIRELFDRDEMQGYPEEVTNIVKGAMTGAILGWVYGGMPAARQARSQYIKQSQAEVYRHRVDAVRAAHNAAIRGFIRYGWRWSWRVAVFVTIFNTVSTGLAVYRDDYALSNFAAAGAVTGGLFRLNLGLRGLTVGSIIGAMLGLPMGALLMAFQKLAGETLSEKKRKARRELYELKLEEWNARLGLMDNVVEEINKDVQQDMTTMDNEKIEELLSLPRNPGVSEDQEGA